MNKEKSPEELRKEKEQLKVQDQITENVFEDKSQFPTSKMLGKKHNSKEANNKTPCIYMQGVLLFYISRFLYANRVPCIFFQILVTVRVICSPRHIVIRRKRLKHISRFLLIKKSLVDCKTNQQHTSES